MKAWIFSIFDSIILFFLPIYGLLISVGIAIFADTYFGVRLARKEKRYKTKELRVGFCKKITSYHLSIISFFIIDHFLLNPFIMETISIEYLLTKFLTFFLIRIEFLSIDETSEKLFGETFSSKIYKTLKDIKSLEEKIRSLFEKESRKDD